MLSQFNSLQLIVIYITFIFQINAQSSDSLFQKPYELNWQIDIPISTSAIALGISFLILDSQTPPLEESYIQSMNIKSINAFDRNTIYNWSPNLSIASDILLYTSCAIPLTLFSNNRIRKDWVKFGIMYAETFALTATLTALTKNLVKRPRPFVYNKNIDLNYKQEQRAQYSFFSGHTSMSAAMCFMTAKIFHDYNKSSKAKPWVWAAAIILPAVTGILRQQSGQHFLTDIVAGYLIGGTIGILIPTLHSKKKFKKKKGKMSKTLF